MKAGDEINCKYCGENSFLVKKTLMDGWIKSGEVLICSSCSKVIEKIDETKNEIKENNRVKTSLNKFSDFLGGETLSKPNIDSDGDKQFCRDCKHYISHPFLDRCSLHQKEVNPMDDCSLFSKKDVNVNKE